MGGKLGQNLTYNLTLETSTLRFSVRLWCYMLKLVLAQSSCLALPKGPECLSFPHVHIC